MAITLRQGIKFAKHFFEHRCECDDASIAVLNKSTKTMIVGY